MTDAVYDPSENPRYLQRVTEEPTPIDRDTWAALQTDLSTVNDILETMGTRGWPHIAERIRLQLETAAKTTASSNDMIEIARAQGAMRACAWLLDLVNQMGRERARLSQAIETSVPLDP